MLDTTWIKMSNINGLKSIAPIAGTTLRIGASMGLTIRSIISLMGWNGDVKKDNTALIIINNDRIWAAKLIILTK